MTRNKIIFLLLIFSIQIFASEEKIHISIHNVKPETYFEEGEFKGPLIKVVEKLLKDQKLKGQFELIPWPRTLNQAKEGLPTLIVRHSMNESRRKFLREILIGFESRKVRFLKRKKLNIEVKSISDLKKLKVGAIRGHFYSDSFSSLKLNKTLVNKTEQLLGMLDVKRIDIMVFHDENELIYSSKQNKEKFYQKYEAVEYQEEFINPFFFSIPTKAGLDKLYKRISCQILKYRKNGFISKVYLEAKLTPLTQDFEHRISIEQESLCE